LDWPGVTFASLGLTLLYAALDQGNRLDWRSSGVINGLLVSGGIMTLAFVVHELSSKSPFLNLRLLLRGELLLLLILLGGFRFIILSTAFVIPSYLQAVQNFRELQVGSVLLWIALPQFAIVLPLAALLKRVDARIVLALGALLVGVACIAATDLTSAWQTQDFLISQIVQALGQSFALTALVVALVRMINPADALTIGALLQTSRLFGGEIGTAFMQTYVRIREQIHSNLLGLHIDPLASLTSDRLLAYNGAMSPHNADLSAVSARATRLLANAVAQQASVLSYIDGFAAAALGAFLCFALTGFMRQSKA
jgi:DHA2 family multidrug resistance protein